VRCAKLSVLVALLAGLWLVSVKASAQAPVPTRVELTLAGNDADVRALSSTLSQALADLSVQLHATRSAAIEPRTVSRRQPQHRAPHLWLDAAQPARVTLYLTSADGSHVFVRSFELERGLDPVALELLGLVARSSLSAMLSGDSVGVSRDEYERSLPATKPPTPNTKRNEPSGTDTGRAQNWRFGALYELEALGASVAQHGAGAQLEWHAGLFSLGLTAELRAPFQVGTGPVQVRLSSRTAQLYLALPVQLSERATLAVGSAFGIDWIRVQGVQRDQIAAPQPAYSVADSVLRVFGSFRYRIGALELSARLGAELGLRDAHYYLLRGEQREAVFTPWRVRPLGALGLSACF
jgi:hypothetical protein